MGVSPFTPRQTRLWIASLVIAAVLIVASFTLDGPYFLTATLWCAAILIVVGWRSYSELVRYRREKRSRTTQDRTDSPDRGRDNDDGQNS
jgi:hypothetical protein